jgi:hypothetical protein
VKGKPADTAYSSSAPREQAAATGDANDDTPF